MFITRLLTLLAVTFALCFPVMGLSSRAAAAPAAPTATVLRVVDGDTVDVRDDLRGRLRIRLLGIDTPETKKPGFTIGCWGPRATDFATATLLGQRVAVIQDAGQGSTDRYGRSLAYLDRADGLP